MIENVRLLPSRSGFSCTKLSIISDSHVFDVLVFFPRPLWVEFPEEKNTFSMEDEFLLGMTMLLNSWL